MTWLLVMVLEILAAMAVGFVLGRIWQIRCDLEQERTDDFTPPTIGRIPNVVRDHNGRALVLLTLGHACPLWSRIVAAIAFAHICNSISTRWPVTQVGACLGFLKSPH